MQQSIQLCEQEAALKFALLLRQEFGFLTAVTKAAFVNNVLKVTLYDALPPIGRLVSHDDHGAEVLRSTYHLLHQLCWKQLHLSAERITGRPVLQSQIELDAERGDVTVVFVLDVSRTNTVSEENYA